MRKAIVDPRIAYEVRKWPEDMRYLFEERAAIIEFDGGSSQYLAEQAAYDEVKLISDQGPPR